MNNGVAKPPNGPRVLVYVDPQQATPTNPYGVCVWTNLPQPQDELTVQLLGEGVRTWGEHLAKKKLMAAQGHQPSQAGLVMPDGAPAIIDNEAPQEPPPIVQPQPIMADMVLEQPQPIVAEAAPENADGE